MTPTLIVEISLGALMLIGALIGIIYNSLARRITDLEKNKVDESKCKLREKVEDQTFDRIERSLNSLDNTFDRKSKDVVGTMETIAKTMESILQQLPRRK